MDDAISNIKQYLDIINPNISELDINLLDFIISEVLDRVLLYLNRNDIPHNLERILANIINTNINKVQNNINNQEVVGQAITSISDNGQTISFSNELKNYFVSTADNELLSGFAGLLAVYRRVKVVNSRDNDK